MLYPASELDYWSLYFSMEDDANNPVVKPEDVDLDTSKKAFKEQWK